MSEVYEKVPVLLNDDITIYVDALQLGGEEDVVFDSLSFKGVATAIEELAKEIIGPLKEAGPSKIEVELGIAIGLESGKLTALLAQTKGTANLKISLGWEKK